MGAKKAGHKVGSMKNFRIDRVIPGVGRIVVSSGTDNPKTLDRINLMIDDLKKDPDRLPDLTALMNKEITPLALLELVRQGKGVTVSAATKGKDDLRDSMNEWLTKHPGSLNTKNTYRKALALLYVLAKPTAVIADLPGILARRLAQLSDSPMSSKAIKNVCRGFARKTFGDTHPVYLAIKALEIPEYTKERENNPQTVAELFTLLKALRHIDRGNMEAFYFVRSMYFTGMGWEELVVNGFSVGEGNSHIHIYGEKTKHRNRKVPYIVQPYPSTMSRRRLSERIQKVFPDVVNGDMRHSYPNVLEMAGVEESRTEMYMGHRAQSMTRVYQYSKLGKHLAEDAEKVRAFVRQELAQHPERDLALKLLLDEGVAENPLAREFFSFGQAS